MLRGGIIIDLVEDADGGSESQVALLVCIIAKPFVASAVEIAIVAACVRGGIDEVCASRDRYIGGAGASGGSFLFGGEPAGNSPLDSCFGLGLFPSFHLVMSEFRIPRRDNIASVNICPGAISGAVVADVVSVVDGVVIVAG